MALTACNKYFVMLRSTDNDSCIKTLTQFTVRFSTRFHAGQRANFVAVIESSTRNKKKETNIEKRDFIGGHLPSILPYKEKERCRIIFRSFALILIFLGKFSNFFFAY